MIIDLDAHQGNGHEMDFANDSNVLDLWACWQFVMIRALWDFTNHFNADRKSLYSGYVQYWNLSFSKTLFSR